MEVNGVDMTKYEKETALLNEAAEWRLTGLLLECPSEGWSAEVKSLAREVSDPKLKSAAGFAIEQAGEGLYHSIFGPGGPAPAREVTYRSWVQPGYLLSELAAYYEAFAFHPESVDSPDHVSVETAFVAYLKIKQAFAIQRGDSAATETTSIAANEFRRDHLAKFAEQISNSLAFSGVDYLKLAGEALLERVGRDEDRKVRQILPVLGNPDDSFDECVV